MAVFTFFGCTDNDKAEKSVIAYYETSQNPYDPFTNTVEDWCGRLFEEGKYNSIVRHWDLGEIKVCILRRKNRLDTSC
jgi:hypothetical protein